jgi:CheY-like chemotaxis protein
MEPVVLIVDDSEREREDMRELLLERLVSLKMRLPVFIEATNGREAFELLEHGLRPDLILLDYFMPEMNGIQLIDAIDAKLGLSTPIIVFSMYLETRSEIVKRGRHFFLKGIQQEADNFYESAVEAYKKALRPVQVDEYKRQLAIQQQYERNKKI